MHLARYMCVHRVETCTDSGWAPLPRPADVRRNASVPVKGVRPAVHVHLRLGNGTRSGKPGMGLYRSCPSQSFLGAYLAPCAGSLPALTRQPAGGRASSPEFCIAHGKRERGCVCVYARVCARVRVGGGSRGHLQLSGNHFTAPPREVGRAPSSPRYPGAWGAQASVLIPMRLGCSLERMGVCSGCSVQPGPCGTPRLRGGRGQSTRSARERECGVAAPPPHARACR